MRRVGRWSLVILSALCVLAHSAAAQDTIELRVRQVVLDIVSFTRWPEPRAKLGLCVIGRAAYADGLLRTELMIGDVPVLARRLPSGGDPDGGSCDIIYEGPVLPGTPDVPRGPVLTIGEGPNCSARTMFCLQIDRLVSFSTNIDAISRSGVRVNPRVLLLGRRPAVQP